MPELRPIPPARLSKRDLRASHPFLHQFSNGFFTIPLGLASQTLLWTSVSEYGFPAPGGWLPVSSTMVAVTWVVSVIALILVLLVYVAKCCFYPEIALLELHHPVRVNFFFAPNISLTMLLLGAPPFARNAGAFDAFFFIAFFLHFAQATYLYGEWILGEDRNLSKISPVFLMSVVPTFLIASLGAEKHPLFATFAFDVGIVFLVIVYVTLFQQLHQRRSERTAALMLFLAPPSAASIASYRLTGDFDGLPLALFYLALFMLVVLLRLLPRFVSGEFGVSRWAFTFPTTSLSVAATTWAHNFHDNGVTRSVALVLFIIALSIVVVVSIRTLIAVKRGNLVSDPLARAAFPIYGDLEQGSRGEDDTGAASDQEGDAVDNDL